VSSLQLAFARIGLDWNDAVFTSAHNRSLSEVVGWAKRMPKVGILTDQKNTPSVIAKTLLDCGIADCRAVVAENLGMENEEIIDTHLEQLPLVDSGPLNVLMLLRDNDWRPWPAFSPRSIDSYVHLRGLITKRDVRTLVLARLALRETDIVWDIGAGSGAVSIEMAELAWRGRVYAIEKERENVECMEKNVAKFGTLNVSIIHGTAPDALTKLERPSAVFIGGTGGAVVSILQYIDNSTAPSCKLVACLSTLENLVKFMNILKELGWIVDVTQTGISHSRQIAGMTRFSPLNPVFILSAQKQGNV
jgi:precorrin-6Y C5,15-methyltransferase (decarboxylating)